MTERKLPKVLLVGNGLNRAYSGDDWINVIKKMWCNPRVNKEDPAVEKLPYPLQVVLATDNMVGGAIKKQTFPTLQQCTELTFLLCDLLRAEFDHILTTNYTYELEAAAYPNDSIEKLCPKLSAHTSAIKRVEQKYLLHTYNNVLFEGHKRKIWHIHGEARKKDSIVIGHQYYGMLLANYQQHFKTIRNKQLLRQEKNEEPLIQTWLDAFVMGDVYVLGFGFDFSEMDLWWLLSRKNSEKAAHGTIHFYEPSFGNEIKHDLLDVYGANIHNMGFRTKSVDYKAFYKAAVKDIMRRL